MERIKSFFSSKHDKFVSPLSNRIKKRLKREQAEGRKPIKCDCAGCNQCCQKLLGECKVATMVIFQCLSIICAALLFSLSVSQLTSTQTNKSGVSMLRYPVNETVGVNATTGTFMLVDACKQNTIIFDHRPLRFNLIPKNSQQPTDKTYFVCPWYSRNQIWRILTCVAGVIVNIISLSMTLKDYTLQSYLSIGGKIVIIILTFIVMGMDATDVSDSREWCLSGAQGLYFLGLENYTINCDYSPFIATVFFDMSFLVWIVDSALTFLYVFSWKKKLKERSFERMNEEGM